MYLRMREGRSGNQSVRKWHGSQKNILKKPRFLVWCLSKTYGAFPGQITSPDPVKQPQTLFERRNRGIIVSSASVRVGVFLRVVSSAGWQFVYYYLCHLAAAGAVEFFCLAWCVDGCDLRLLAGRGYRKQNHRYYLFHDGLSFRQI